jgi:hypothetical protein
MMCSNVLNCSRYSLIFFILREKIIESGSDRVGMCGKNVRATIRAFKNEQKTQ